MLLKLLLCGVSLFIICDTVGIFRGGTCPSIRLKYGRTRYRQKGRFAKFACNTGYLLAGEKYNTCVNGTWDGPVPRCVRASCKRVTSPANGLIYPSHRGAVLNFFCKPGYDLRGTTTLYCDGISWDSNLPSCIPTNTTPPLTCNFETSDLCGWNHDLRHDFDWTRLNLKTPSGHLGTGPSFDHTFGEGKDGFYMYIESSSRKINDTARLISPVYDKMISNVCLEFYYHMHGTSTGQLRVYLKRISDTWVLYPENAIFWKVGNHGDKWLHSFIQLGPINEDFQIIIEGVRGTSFYSDIAIDDVSIIPNCTIKDVTTERDEVYTIDYLPTQSCYNRCDSDNTTMIKTEQQSCRCDDTCTDSGTCCPDYIALCVVGTTEDGYVQTETTFMQPEISSTRSSTVQVSKMSDSPIKPALTSMSTVTRISQNITTPFTTRSSTTIKKTTTRPTKYSTRTTLLLTTFTTELPVPFTKKISTTPPTKTLSTKFTVPVNISSSIKPPTVSAKPTTSTTISTRTTTLRTPEKPVKLPSEPAKPTSAPTKPPIKPTKQQSDLEKPSNATGKPTNTPEKVTVVPAKTPSSPAKPSSTSVKPPNVSAKPSSATVKPTNVTVKPPTATIKTVKPPTVPEKLPSPPGKPLPPPEKVPVAPAKPTSPPEKSPEKSPIVPSVPNFTKYVAKQSVATLAPSYNPTTSKIEDVITVPVHLDYKDNEEEGDAEPVVYKDKGLATSNVQNQKIVKEAQSNSTTIVVVAVLSVSVILIVVLGAALVRRYRYSCNRSRIRGSSSESQSDVRFLTSDEVLDFSLAYQDE